MFSPVKLSGSIQTIFIIGAAGWALSLIVFGVEMRHAVRNFGFITYKKILLGLRKFIFVFLKWVSTKGLSILNQKGVT